MAVGLISGSVNAAEACILSRRKLVTFFHSTRLTWQHYFNPLRLGVNWSHMSMSPFIFTGNLGWPSISYRPVTGIFTLGRVVTRPFPTDFNETTRETIHASVLEQDKINPLLSSVVAKHPELVTKLLPLEEEVRLNWPRFLEAAKVSRDASWDFRSRSCAAYDSSSNLVAH